MGAEEPIYDYELNEKGELKTNNLYKNGTRIRWQALGPQILTSVAMAFGALLLGYAVGYSSPALASMSSKDSLIQPDIHQRSWIGSMIALTATLGGLAGGPLISWLGRKFTILSTGLPYITGFVMIALADNVLAVMAGRAITGFCLGILCLAPPIYLAEVVQPKYRGVLSLFPNTFGNAGVLLSYTAGMYLNWSDLAWLGAILPIPFIVLTYLVPETPRYYISKGQTKKAINALEWLRGTGQVSEELNHIQNSFDVSLKRTAFASHYWKPASICLLLMFFQQMSGINAVFFYSFEIFNASGNKINPNIQSIILAGVNILSTLTATLLIDRLGRKTLLYISSITMTLTLAVLGFYFRLSESLSEYSWIPLVSLVVYIVGFAIGFGPVPWLLMGELLPGEIRGVGAAACTSFNWACSFLITKTFESMIVELGSDMTFWLYGISCSVALIFVIIAVPETKGKSLEDIQLMFRKTNNDDKS